jgi:repressor LexA
MGRLAEVGFVERTADDDAWIPGKRFFERVLIESSVPAGVPATATDVDSQPLLFDEFLVKKPNETFVIPISGDSMIEAGIYDGDLAVVERTNKAKVGTFVIANVDNEFTLKELVKEGGKYALKPHNQRYPLIYPEGELQVVGTLVGLVRRYRP